MSRKGKRERLADGISRDATGYAVRVKVRHNGEDYSREKRLPPTFRWPEDAPLLRAERDQLKADLRSELQDREPEPPSAGRGTFAGDVRRYLARVKPRLDPDTFASRTSELARWVEVFGLRPRHTLRAADIERAIQSWQHPQARAPIVKRGRTYQPRPWVAPSPKTVQNRVRSLRHLYAVLDGPRARTPLDAVELKTAPKRRPRAIDVPTIRRVIANLIRQERRGRLRDAKSRARFLVMVTTGQRPVQIARTTEADVRLDQQVWYVPPAKGGDEVLLPLNGEMVAAWSLFIAANAWGAWDSRSFARTLRYAGWPAGVRPYNARHSVGIALSEAGVDLGDIQPFLSHRQLATTREFYVPGLSSRLKAASERIDHRVQFSPRWARYVGTPPEQRKNRRKSA